MPGRMVHRVAFQSHGSTQDAAGQESRVWTTQTTVWAAIAPMSGNDRFSGATGEQPEVSHRIDVRAMSANRPIPNDWRILHGARVFDIVSGPLDTMERGRAWRYLCLERQATSDD